MDKAALIAGRSLPQVAVDVPGIGAVTVRSITRGEYLRAGRVNSGGAPDPLQFERVVLAAALVDPEMAEHEVAEWQRVAPPGELQAVMEAVMEISGLRQGADKSGVSEVRD